MTHQPFDHLHEWPVVDMFKKQEGKQYTTRLGCDSLAVSVLGRYQVPSGRWCPIKISRLKVQVSFFIITVITSSTVYSWLKLTNSFLHSFYIISLWEDFMTMAQSGLSLYQRSAYCKCSDNVCLFQLDPHVWVLLKAMAAVVFFYSSVHNISWLRSLQQEVKRAMLTASNREPKTEI